MNINNMYLVKALSYDVSGEWYTVHAPKRGCFICKGNQHSSLHEERGEKESVNTSLNCGYTPSGECALPSIPVEVKGETIWGFLDTCSTNNYNQ